MEENEMEENEMTEATAATQVFGEIGVLIWQHQMAERQMSVDFGTSMYEETLRLRAEIDLIRWQVEDALSGPYMPTPSTVIEATRVTEKKITKLVERRRPK